MKVAAELDVSRVRADFPILQEQVNGHQLAYLDSDALMARRLETLGLHVHRVSAGGQAWRGIFARAVTRQHAGYASIDIDNAYRSANNHASGLVRYGSSNST